MNPATPGPLTVLLVPPAGDAALLADEAGCGRVPMALPSALPGTWFAPSRIDGDISDLPGRALLLVHEGAPVRLGLFRAWDMADDLSSDNLGAALTMEPAEIAEWVAALLRNNEPIGRVVLLRDGREVGS